MSADIDLTTIAPGMVVYGADGAVLGPVEAVQAASIQVLRHMVPAAAITRVDAAGVHLMLARAAFSAAPTPAASAMSAGDATATQGEQIVIPVVEERLTVGTREVDLGEVIVRKRVVEETTMVPVTTRREEIEIVRREAGQPWPPGADEAAPGVELTRVPLRGEEPVIGIRQVVAREVVIDKGRVAEERQITDTVRREHVEVEERYRQVRPHLQEQFAAQRPQAPDAWARGRTFEQAEPQYRAGFSAASDPRYAQRDFAEVEPQLRQDLDTTALDDGDRWQQLRAEIRAGWDAARRR